jgi:hypothetical protein
MPVTTEGERSLIAMIGGPALERQTERKGMATNLGDDVVMDTDLERPAVRGICMPSAPWDDTGLV